MKKKYTHLTQEEREQLGMSKKHGHPLLELVQ